MLIELGPNDFYRVLPIFSGFERVALRAVLCGGTPGRVFVDNVSHPRAAFIWDEFRYSFVGGDPADAAFCAGLRELLETRLFPEARASFDPSVVLYPTSPAWIEPLTRLLGSQKYIPLQRSQFRLDRAVLASRSERQAPLPEGFCLAPIDAALLECSPDLAFGVRVLWGSAENFLANGLGFCLLLEDGGQIASTCLAAFVANRSAEISVDTAEPYRRRGLGAAVSTAFMGECLERGLEPVWECWRDNATSHALASHLGYEWIEDYPVLYVPLN